MIKTLNFNRKIPILNLLAAVSKLVQFRLFHVASFHSAINVYLATDRGGYVYEHSSRSNCSMAECFPEQLELE